jgi:hypothetical protein
MTESASLSFRLRSATGFDVVSFDGKSIKAREAKILIAARIGCNEVEIDLYQTDADDSPMIGPDDELIAYSEVVVQRKLATQKLRPVSVLQKEAKSKEDARRIFGTASGDATALNVATAALQNLTEEERIALLSDTISRDNVATRGRGGMRGGGPGGRGGMGLIPGRAPPPGYICHACGKGGHFIEHCPESAKSDGKRYSVPLGIAESKLQRVDADDPSAKFVTKDGFWVKRIVEGSAFNAATVAGADTTPATDDTACPNCGNVFMEAVRLPCCDVVVCSPCLDKLMEADDGPECNACNEPIMADDVEPATDVRERVAQARKRAREE